MKSPKKERGRSSAVSLTTSPGRRAGEVRIVGGRWRRTPLVVTDREGLRPTPERVRETVFDWLGHLLGSYAGRRALDLFAGSGALGLEALSRGFAALDLVERDRAQAAGIRAALERLGALDEAALHVEDAFALLARTPLLWDVIFIDPPFALGLQDDALTRALERLAPDGILYVERSGELTGGALLERLGLVRLRATTAGQVSCELLARADGALAPLAKTDKKKMKKTKPGAARSKEKEA